MANKKLPGAAVHHIALRVRDMEEAKRFYIEGLGFDFIAQWPEAGKEICMLAIGNGGILELFDGSEGIVASDHEFCQGAFFHLAIAVDDVDDAYKTALAAGAIEKAPPKDVTLPAAEPIQIRIGFVYGLSGECLEFYKHYVDDK